jgi:hypothetical protein
MADHGQDRVEREIEGEILMGEDGGEGAGGPMIESATGSDHAAERRSAGTQLPADQVESRAVLAASLERGIFPADRDALLESARRLNASAEVKAALSALPDGTFEHVEAVWEALGGDVEYRA